MVMMPSFGLGVADCVNTQWQTSYDREIIATCLSELGVTAQLFGNVADTVCISGMKLDSESVP